VNSHLKTIVIWLVVIAAVVIGYKIFDTASTQRQQLDQSEFYAAVEEGDVRELTITGDSVGFEIRGKFKAPRPVGPNGREMKNFTTYVVKDDNLMEMLREKGVMVKAEKPRDSSFLALLLTWSPMLLFLGVWIFFMRQMQSGGNRARSPSGTWRASRKRKKSCKRSSNSSRNPRSSRNSAGRSPRACC
jgi:cell division protease FtsH